MKHAHVWGLALLGACSTAETPAPLTPVETFSGLEERLLAAETVTFVFHITSEGAVESDVRGRFELHGDHANVFAEGQFATRPLKVELVTTDGDLRGGRDAANVLGPRPPGLREGLLIGLLRMGLLHNIAVLSSDRPPDGIDGNVREWVQAGAVTRGEEGDLQFELYVDGQHTGEAALTLEGGLPTKRRQTVRFVQGEMRVVERYSQFVAKAPEREE